MGILIKWNTGYYPSYKRDFTVVHLCFFILILDSHYIQFNDHHRHRAHINRADLCNRIEREYVRDVVADMCVCVLLFVLCNRSEYTTTIATCDFESALALSAEPCESVSRSPRFDRATDRRHTRHTHRDTANTLTKTTTTTTERRTCE